MSLETLSFILGGILIGAGLFGGGLEIKELKLPQIGPIARASSLTVGAVFVGLAVFLNAPSTAKVMPVSPEDTKKVTMTFQEPMQGDLRLDACLEWAQKCGEPAATAWCKSKGMARALEYPQDNVGGRGLGTRLLGGNQTCNEKFCTSFAFIVCEK